MFLRRHESGNALFLILIAVALFAALAYAVTQSGKGGGTIDKEQILLNASKIVQYAGDVQHAVTRLRLTGGCADTQISFDNTVFNNYWGSNPYPNAGAPADKSCNVFNAAGGNVTYVQAPADVFVPCCAGGVNAGNDKQWVFIGAWNTVDTSTPAPDLTMVVGGLRKDVCVEMNNKLGVTNPGGNPPGVAGTCYAATVQNEGYFTGTYSSSNITWCTVSKAFAGCVYDGAGQYYFYQTLIAR